MLLRGLFSLPLCVFLASCSAPREPIEIHFQVRYGDRSISCVDDTSPPVLTDLRFYVHDVRLLDAEGLEHPVSLSADPVWQDGEVALLDFENGEGRCDNGTRETNTVLRGRVAAGTHTGLGFRVGVPPHLNHADPLRASPPLNYSFMHWHWNTGYKFLMAGVASDDDGFWMHLGSTRCEGSASDIKGCRSRNEPLVVLPEFVPGRDVVVIDLVWLVNDVDLADGEATDCSSGPTEATCRGPFAALGLDFASGDPTGTPPVFRVGTQQ